MADLSPQESGVFVYLANESTGHILVIDAGGALTANIGTTGGLALDTTLAKLTISQGTALGANTVALMGASVTTAAPTYTTGQISPLSLTTAGALRTDVSGTVTANQGTANATPWNENLSQVGGTAITLGQKAMTASVPVVLASDQTHIPVELQDGAGNAIASELTYGDQRLLVSSQSFDTETTAANMMYSISLDINVPTAGTETPLVLFKNPSGSGKNYSLRRIILSGNNSGNGTATFKIYANPTTTANGTAATVSSTNIGGGAAAATATPFTGPTVTANGTRFFSGMMGSGTNGGPLFYPLEGITALAANNTILITGTPSANNISVSITFVWAEL